MLDSKRVLDCLPKKTLLELSQTFGFNGLAHMISHVRSVCMVHICVGCYSQAVYNMPQDCQINVLMPFFKDGTELKRRVDR